MSVFLSGAPPTRQLRQAELQPQSGAVLPPVRLELGSLPVAREYAVSSFWEERPVGGAVQRNSIEKKFRLGATQQSNGLVLSYRAISPPVLRKLDPTALEKAVLLLAELYQKLELQATLDGRLVAVLNQAEVQQIWQGVRAELIHRSGGEDEVTQLLLDGVDEQLQLPQSLLASLRYDYLFEFLLKNIYQQRFESGQRYGQALVLPRFFADADLWCWERLELVPPTDSSQVALRLSGVLDRDQTDVTAVVQQMLAAQAAGAHHSPAPTVPDPAHLRFTYEAAYEVDAATGWPVSVEASVRCWMPDVYSKEYFLRLELVS
jgi:hypothetical protein